MSPEDRANAAVQDEKPQTKAKSFRITMVDKTKDGRPAVNIRLPIGVVKWGMKMAQAFSPQMKEANLDWDSISAMIQEGAEGKLVDVDDEAEQKHVEIWVE
jgi:hypothetical protein